jgi:hypothetical protein
MSTTASRYADYGSACPRCQQIINTIDITFQQGIFIYDLTFIQQELESVLVAALERQNQLLEQDGNDLKLPLSSMIRLPNGKKPRDFKAERERRRKALSGHMSRKRRVKKSSTKHLLKTIKYERNENNFESLKKSSEINGDCLRPIRSYRSMIPYSYEGNHHHHKFQINHIINPDQFWMKILANQKEYLKKNDWNFIEKLIEIDQSLLDNFDYEKDYQQHKQIINSQEYLFSQDKYIHPEFEYSIVLKRNLHVYNLVENILNNTQHKNNSIKSRKRKYSTMNNDIDIDQSILNFFRRDNQ